MIKPATNICEVQQFDDYIFYKAHCSCMADEHTQTLILENDSDGIILLSIHGTIYTHHNDSWCDKPMEKLDQWWKSQKLKWKQVFKLITTAQIEGENEFMFYGKDQIQSYIDALQDGLNRLEKGDK